MHIEILALRHQLAVLRVAAKRVSIVCDEDDRTAVVVPSDKSAEHR
jgi:hypothetical protein